MSLPKIMIVEDERVVALDFQNILENHGFELSCTAASGQEALKKAEECRPDLVLMDIVLQGELTGIQTAELLRSRFDIPSLFITAHSDERLITEAKHAAPLGYLLKPVNERQLFITLVLAFHKHTQELEEKLSAEQALRKSEEWYRQLVENVNEGIMMQDREGIITYANGKFCELIGYAKNEVLGKASVRFFGEGLLRPVDPEFKPEEQVSGKAYEMAWRRKDEKRVFTLISSNPVFDENKQFMGTVSVLTDISERRAIEMELSRSQEKLRSLSHHIQSAREEESKRIAREIHDELGQKLTALKMDFSWFFKRISGKGKDTEDVMDKAQSMTGLIDDTIQTVQKISSELRPGLLDDLGLLPAIEWFAQEFQARTKIACRLDFDCEDIDLGTERSTAIFRITQESLTNVARHAKATRVIISAKQDLGSFFLNIEDNGIGITEKKIFASSSLGLMGMRERVRPFGGNVEITGKKKRHTRISITLPLPVEDDE